MKRTIKDKKEGPLTLQEIQRKQLLGYTILTTILLFVSAFLLASPTEILCGMKDIILTRDALITDYFELTSYGAALFNSGVFMLFGLLIVVRLNIPFTGFTFAALFINAGFALFGKNPVNTLPILIGTYLYARANNVKVSRYIYTAMFGTCLAPIITEVAYILPFALPINLFLAVAVGIVIGFILPPVAIHTVAMHKGYNLFNVGFAAGFIGFVIVSIFNAFGYNGMTAVIWCEENPLWLILGLYGYFLATFFYGLYLNKGECLKPLRHLWTHPGRAIADFILMDGLGTTLMNMGLVGSMCLTYILLIGGDLSGPVVGGILTVFGFAAFGIHIKNYWSILLGVYLCTTFTIYSPVSPSMQLAAIFCAGLAPIAGQFGWVAGVLAGILHVTIVSNTGGLYSGLNLYNNGFSAGIVAIIMIPSLESYMKRFIEK